MRIKLKDATDDMTSTEKFLIKNMNLERTGTSVSI